MVASSPTGTPAARRSSPPDLGLDPADRPDAAPAAGGRGRPRLGGRRAAGRAARGAAGAARRGQQDLPAAARRGRTRPGAARGGRPHQRADPDPRSRGPVRPGRRGCRLLRRHRVPRRARRRRPDRSQRAHRDHDSADGPVLVVEIAGVDVRHAEAMLDRVCRLGGTIDISRGTGIGTITARIPCE